MGEISRELRKGMYQHPIIQKAINTMWFANKHDEGVSFYAYFNPVPIEALAFVLTAVCFMIAFKPTQRRFSSIICTLVHSQIECGIDEWGSGSRADIAFTAHDYRVVYEAHKANLEAFDTLSDDAHRVLLNIRKNLHSEARYVH